MRTTAQRLGFWMLAGGLLAARAFAAPSQELSRELQRDYHFDPTPVTPPTPLVAPLAEPKDNPEVVRLDPFHVTAFSTVQEAFADAAERERLKQEQEFDWLRGGRIAEMKLGAVGVSLGVWPELIPIDPDISHQHRQMKLSVDILHISW